MSALLKDFQRHSVASSASALAPLATRQASEGHTRLLEVDTGKSLSEVLISLSINPQYDKRLFNELRGEYDKIIRAGQEHVVYTNILNV